VEAVVGSFMRTASIFRAGARTPLCSRTLSFISTAAHGASSPRLFAVDMHLYVPRAFICCRRVRVLYVLPLRALNERHGEVAWKNDIGRGGTISLNQSALNSYHYYCLPFTLRACALRLFAATARTHAPLRTRGTVPSAHGTHASNIGGRTTFAVAREPERNGGLNVGGGCGHSPSCNRRTSSADVAIAEGDKKA